MAKNKIDIIAYRVLLEKLVIGIEEPILVKGVGKLTAKVDSGNGGYNVIHGEDFVIQGDILDFKTYDSKGNPHRISKKIIDTMSVNIGSGNIQERPVIELDIKFAGQDYKKIPFSVTDRADNNQKVLISKDFIGKELDALIDVNKKNISNDEVSVEYVSENVIKNAYKKAKKINKKVNDFDDKFIKFNNETGRKLNNFGTFFGFGSFESGGGNTGEKKIEEDILKKYKNLFENLEKILEEDKARIIKDINKNRDLPGYKEFLDGESKADDKNISVYKLLDYICNSIDSVYFLDKKEGERIRIANKEYEILLKNKNKEKKEENEEVIKESEEINADNKDANNEGGGNEDVDENTDENKDTDNSKKDNKQKKNNNKKDDEISVSSSGSTLKSLVDEIENKRNYTIFYLISNNKTNGDIQKIIDKNSDKIQNAIKPILKSPWDETAFSSAAYGVEKVLREYNLNLGFYICSGLENRIAINIDFYDGRNAFDFNYESDEKIQKKNIEDIKSKLTAFISNLKNLTDISLTYISDEKQREEVKNDIEKIKNVLTSENNIPSDIKDFDIESINNNLLTYINAIYTLTNIASSYINNKQQEKTDNIEKIKEILANENNINSNIKDSDNKKVKSTLSTYINAIYALTSIASSYINDKKQQEETHGNIEKIKEILAKENNINSNIKDFDIEKIKINLIEYISYGKLYTNYISKYINLNNIHNSNNKFKDLKSFM